MPTDLDQPLPTRRDLIELTLRAAALPGGALFFTQWLRGAEPPPRGGRYQPKFFSPEDFEALAAFTEILIPTDESPGAREARCAEFIDFVVSASADVPGTQDGWRNAMKALKSEGFHEADAPRRLQLVTEMSRPELDRSATHPAFAAYRLIKHQTTFAFYTSRAGMIETLDYKGNSYNPTFPACHHPEHQTI